MCKYCKRLKELNALDKKEYGEIIECWRRYTYRADLILFDVISFLAKLCDTEDISVESLVYINDLIDRIVAWRKINYLGK